jgi:putative oxidoreductase
MSTRITPFQATWAPRALGLLRIVTGYLFIAHGSAKLLGLPHIAMFDGLQAMSLPWIAGVLELGGGALIVAGLFTRPAAFILSGLMAFAYFIGHAPQGNVLLPLLNQGELAVLYSFLFLFLSVVGGGDFALDNLRGRNRGGALAPIVAGRA